MNTNPRRHWLFLVSIGAIVATALIGLPAALRAYDLYSDGAEGKCAFCHELATPGGFQNRGLLHDAHTNSATGNCQLCHTRSGDIPALSSSGEVGGKGCIGCHGQPLAGGVVSGAGLRLHHANKGVGTDIDGLACSDCHPADPVPPVESTLPVYYLRDDVIPKSPCNADGLEDFWNRDTGQPDGLGLDNDGDLRIDAADGDCAPVSCVDRDGDGFGNPGDPTCPKGGLTDCDDARATVYPGAVEAYDTLDNDCDTQTDEIEGDGFFDTLNRNRYGWQEQPPAGQQYDVIRSDRPDFSAASALSACLVVGTPLLYVDDAGVPAPRAAFYYLVRNTLVADYGKQSNGTLRLSTLCP